MLCRRVLGGDVHSSVTELERWGTSCRERRGGRAGTPCPEIQQGMHIPGCNPHLAEARSCPGNPGTPSLGALLPSPICSWARAGTHHMDNVEGEDLDAAHNSRECADDGGEDGQATDAEEEVLGRSGVSRGCPQSMVGCTATPQGALGPQVPHLERHTDAPAVGIGEHGQHLTLPAAGCGMCL